MLDKKNQQDMISILKNNDVAKAAIFGSHARNEASNKSDIDLLIEFNGKKSLLDLASLKIKLEDQLDKKFDIVTYKSLNHLIREEILSQAKQIYAKE